jgi:hypothetical protein
VETEEERIRREQKNAEREDELKRIPLQTIDTSRWPRYVRPIAMGKRTVSASITTAGCSGTASPSKSSVVDLT